MSVVSTEIKDEIALVKMENGVTNPINFELISDLESAVDRVRDNCRGMILTGNNKFFSIGFDLPSLMPLKRDEFTEFITRFENLILSIFTLPFPTICTIAGHAAGGGNIIALTGDYRYMVNGKKRIGLNEVDLGSTVPYIADIILRQLVGDRFATEMLYGGELLSADAAKDIGLIDLIAHEESLEEEAMNKLKKFAGKPKSGLAEIKETRVRNIKRNYSKNGTLKIKNLVDIWYLPETRALLAKASEKF